MGVNQFAAVGVGMVLIALGVVVGKVFADINGLSKGAKMRRWLGLAAVVLGGFVGAGAFFEPPPPPPSETLPWHHETEIRSALDQAKEAGKPVLIDFWTETCTNCKVLERETLSAPTIRNRLASEFVLIKVNTNTLYASDRSTYDRLRAAYGNIDSQPFVVFLNGNGEFIERLSFHGLRSIEEVGKVLPEVREATPEGASAGLAEQIESQGLLWVLLLVFVSGIGASLTPCVYPLIPITISVFGAREASSKLAAFGLSWVYVSGIVVTYTALGLIAASVGRGIGEAMSSPWVLAGIALVLGAMGLSSLGAYEVGLPIALQTKLSEKGGKGVVGAFVMGLLAGLIATPCVGPILVTILVFVAQTQNLVLGAGLLATFALGMGMLFLVLGTFAGLLSKLPTSGPWMVGVKTVFGAVFVVFALYYLRLAFPVISSPIHLVYDVTALLMQ